MEASALDQEFIDQLRRENDACAAERDELQDRLSAAKAETDELRRVLQEAKGIQTAYAHLLQVMVVLICLRMVGWHGKGLWVRLNESFSPAV